MLQASSSVSRNAQILLNLNSSQGTELVQLYQPGLVNPNDVFTSLRYSGFITALRMVVDIRSIAPVDFPTPPVGATDEEVQALAAQLTATNPTKTLSFFLENSASGLVRVADISLFNRRPYYYNNMLPYLTDTDTFDCASDTVLSVQMKLAGGGPLVGSDSIIFIGSAVEETTVQVQPLRIYVNGGSGSGGETEPDPDENGNGNGNGPEEPPIETFRVTDNSGNLVVDSNANLVKR